MIGIFPGDADVTGEISPPPPKISQTRGVVPTRQEFLFMDAPAFKLAFYGLTFLSLAIMAYGFLAPVMRWRKGRPTPGQAAGIGGVLRYVVAQRKVMASRPKTGAPMHLLIFYGFLAMFIATTLLALASYGPIFGFPNWHRGGYYLAYEFIFDTLGLALIVGVVWAWRRRVSWLATKGEPIPDPEGKLSRSKNPLTNDWRDFAALGLLFLLGVGGYLLAAARINANPQPWDRWSWVSYGLAQLFPGKLRPEGYIALWWSHAAIFWTFVIALPHMRLKHIVVATFAAYGTREEPMGKLPAAVENPETGLMGAGQATDYSRWHLMSLDACMSCGRCTEVCPAYGAGKTLNPKQVVQDIHQALIIGDGVPARVSEGSLWACTTCNACVEACPVLIRHVDLIVDARRNLVSDNKLTGSATTVLRQVGSTGSAWGQQSRNREDWMKGMDIPLARDGQPFDVLFWVGCAGATDPGAIKTTQAVARLLQKAGVRFACLGQEEACTGDPARRLGDEATFEVQANQNVSVFERYGVKKVVTACPHCFNTLKNEYGDYGAQMEVFHHTQLLQSLVAEGKLQPAQPEPGSVTYHDPCYLARVNDISDAPRALAGHHSQLDDPTPLMLKDFPARQPNVTVFAEPEHHGRKTLCCGAGGGRMWMDEEPGQRPAERRVDELLATGASQIAVACPFCRIMLDASVKQAAQAQGRDEIKLIDLAEMLQEANR